MSYLPIAPRENSGAHIAVSWVVAFLTMFYMLPWAIAATRHKQNTGSIAAFNLLLGWTGVGWIITLVMACLADPVRYVHPGAMTALPPAHSPYGHHPYGHHPYAHPHAHSQNPYAQNPYAQNPYAQNPYAQNPYAQNPYAQNPYGVSSGHDPYGSPYGPPPAEAAEPSGYVGSPDFDPDRRDGQVRW